MTELIINETYPKASVNPIIFTFQNGYTNENFDESECKLFINQISDKKQALTRIDDMLYAGEEELDATNNTFLLARDKITNKVRIIECTAIELRPELKDNFKKTELQEASFLELSRKFGSKKQKQKVESREKFKVNVEMVKTQMKAVKENVQVNTSDIALYTESNAEDAYLPPINRDATSVEDIFEISKILTDEQFDIISGEIESKDIEVEMLPIVKEIISQNNVAVKDKVLGLYANSLLKLYNTLSKDMKGKDYILCNSSRTLNELILNNFTQLVNGRRNRPTQLKDKGLCHAIVFLLLINKYKVSLAQLSETVKLTPNTVTTKVKAVGAYVVNNGQNKMVVLKLPLNNNMGFKRRKSAKF